jgi:hypothetical protein
MKPAGGTIQDPKGPTIVRSQAMALVTVLSVTLSRAAISRSLSPSSRS